MDELRLPAADLELVRRAESVALAVAGDEELVMLQYQLRRARGRHRDVYIATSRQRNATYGGRGEATMAGADELARLEAVSSALRRVDDEIARRARSFGPRTGEGDARGLPGSTSPTAASGG